MMAAVIMRRVVVNKATRNKVVKPTHTMSATAGKTHRAHLQRAQRVGLSCSLARHVDGDGTSRSTLVHRLIRMAGSLCMHAL